MPEKPETNAVWEIKSEFMRGLYHQVAALAKVVQAMEVSGLDRDPVPWGSTADELVGLLASNLDEADWTDRNLFIEHSRQMHEIGEECEDIEGCICDGCNGPDATPIHTRRFIFTRMGYCSKVEFELDRRTKKHVVRRTKKQTRSMK